MSYCLKLFGAISMDINLNNIKPSSEGSLNKITNKTRKNILKSFAKLKKLMRFRSSTDNSDFANHNLGNRADEGNVYCDLDPDTINDDSLIQYRFSTLYSSRLQSEYDGFYYFDPNYVRILPRQLESSNVLNKTIIPKETRYKNRVLNVDSAFTLKSETSTVSKSKKTNTKFKDSIAGIKSKSSISPTLSNPNVSTQSRIIDVNRCEICGKFLKHLAKPRISRNQLCHCDDKVKVKQIWRRNSLEKLKHRGSRDTDTDTDARGLVVNSSFELNSLDNSEAPRKKKRNKLSKDQRKRQKLLKKRNRSSTYEIQDPTEIVNNFVIGKIDLLPTILNDG